MRKKEACLGKFGFAYFFCDRFSPTFALSFYFKLKNMKSIVITVFLLMSIGYLHAQTAACCVKATDQFAALGKDKSFVMSHDEPLPFVYESTKGKDITYKLADGTTAHAFEIKADKQTPYYLFVIHEFWGLNDYVKQESERLSNELGVNILALDLYDDKVTANRDSAVKLMQSVNNNRAIAIIKGAFAYAGSSAKVFTLGWCFGGGWSLQAALLGGSQVKGCVMYYGMPEKDVNRLKTLQCDVIGFFGKQDDFINPEVVKQFDDNMKAAGKKATTYEYDAPHAFANPSNPRYNKEATADANAKTLAFIKERMK